MRNPIASHSGLSPFEWVCLMPFIEAGILSFSVLCRIKAIRVKFQNFEI